MSHRRSKRVRKVLTLNGINPVAVVYEPQTFRKIAVGIDPVSKEPRIGIVTETIRRITECGRSIYQQLKRRNHEVHAHTKHVGQFNWPKESTRHQ